MKRHRYQWLIAGLILIVTAVIGGVVWVNQPPKATETVKHRMVKTHYHNWKKTYLKGSDQAKFVVTNGAERHYQTLSEAQGYGMLIAVFAAQQDLDDRRTFDQLTRYYLAHRISADNPLMAWRQSRHGNEMVSGRSEKSSATDGDLDIAYALILADELWGSDGALDYAKLAHQLLAAIGEREINPVTKLPQVGDWAAKSGFRDLLRPSDLITAYFRKFAAFTKDGSWTRVAQNSQRALKQLSSQHASGLMADFVTVSGPQLKFGTVEPKQVDSEYDHQYGFNACRIPWRVAYDYQMSQSPVSYEIVKKMLRFFKHEKQLGTVYSLNGQPLENYDNAAFTTPLAYAAYAVNDHQLSKRYAPELSKKLVKQGYYPATIHMVTLLTSGSINTK